MLPPVTPEELAAVGVGRAAGVVVAPGTVLPTDRRGRGAMRAAAVADRHGRRVVPLCRSILRISSSHAVAGVDGLGRRNIVAQIAGRAVAGHTAGNVRLCLEPSRRHLGVAVAIIEIWEAAVEDTAHVVAHEIVEAISNTRVRPLAEHSRDRPTLAVGCRGDRERKEHRSKDMP